MIPDELLAVQLRVTVCWFAPVAESAAAVGEFVALLRTERLPVTLPAVVGLKVTLKLVFCPAANVNGRAGPVKLKPVPVPAAWDSVTLKLPVFVITTGRVLLVFTVTSPKLRLLGLAESVWVVPVPESGTVGSDALLAIVRLPEKFPAVVGEKMALKETLCPAVRLNGRDKPLMLNPLPVTPA